MPLRLISPPPPLLRSPMVMPAVQRPETEVRRIPRIMMVSPQPRRHPGAMIGAPGCAPGGSSERSDIGGAPANRLPVAVEQGVGVEGNDLALRRHEMDTGALDLGEAEIEAIQELHDHDPEDLVIAEPRRHFE